MGSPVVPIIAAVIARARRSVTDHFLGRNATSAATATDYTPGRHIERRQFDRLVRRGVIRDAGHGRWYLQPDAYAREQAAKRRKLAAVAALVAVTAALLIIFGTGRPR